MATSHAQNINFGKITSKEQAFKQYWNLSDEEVKRYQLFMEVAGKYRYANLSPLYVLSIMADSPEDKQYYAQKAAQQEHDAVKREVETAYLVSTAMDGELTHAMQAFTDKLTGIDTMRYDPNQAYQDALPKDTAAVDKSWLAGDQFILLLDERCLNSGCLRQHQAAIAVLPQGVEKIALLRTKQTPDDSAQKTLETLGLTIKPFDAIEYASLLNLANNLPVHLRAGKVVAP